MAVSGPQRMVPGPPPGLAFRLDEWVPCEAYLGCTEQRETDTATNDELARVVAKLHQRHEQNYINPDTGHAHAGATQVYVKVTPTGLFLRVITESLASEEIDGPREGIKEFFETVRIARCSANHEPCNRALVWVYNRQPLGRLARVGDGRVECHGVVCRDLRDATRLANTLAMAFYEMRQQPDAFGNAFGAVGGAVTMPGLMRNMPGELPPAYTPSARDGEEPMPPARRGKNHGGRQMQVLEVVEVHGEEDDEDSELDLTPRSTGSTSPRTVTPRNATSTTVGNSMLSLNPPDEPSPRGFETNEASMRNSTVSLHSTAAMSEGRRGRHGRRTLGLPDVAADSWGDSVV